MALAKRRPQIFLPKPAAQSPATITGLPEVLSALTAEYLPGEDLAQPVSKAWRSKLFTQRQRQCEQSTSFGLQCPRVSGAASSPKLQQQQQQHWEVPAACSYYCRGSEACSSWMIELISLMTNLEAAQLRWTPYGSDQVREQTFQKVTDPGERGVVSELTVRDAKTGQRIANLTGFWTDTYDFTDIIAPDLGIEHPEEFAAQYPIIYDLWISEDPKVYRAVTGNASANTSLTAEQRIEKLRQVALGSVEDDGSEIVLAVAPSKTEEGDSALEVLTTEAAIVQALLCRVVRLPGSYRLTWRALLDEFVLNAEASAKTTGGVAVTGVFATSSTQHLPSHPEAWRVANGELLTEIEIPQT